MSHCCGCCILIHDTFVLVTHSSDTVVLPDVFGMRLVSLRKEVQAQEDRMLTESWNLHKSPWFPDMLFYFFFRNKITFIKLPLLMK